MKQIVVHFREENELTEDEVDTIASVIGNALDMNSVEYLDITINE